jgi:hypothetical protein
MLGALQLLQEEAFCSRYSLQFLTLLSLGCGIFIAIGAMEHGLEVISTSQIILF